MMKASYVILQIELEAIKNFLDHVDVEAGSEIDNLFQKYNIGEFDDEEDFDNKLYFPVMRQEIGARAVYYELNALIERELYRSAYEPWLESIKHSGLKQPDDNDMTVDPISSLKTIEDLPFRKIISLIEEKYNIRLKDLDSGMDFFRMREMVNAFKHRNGRVDYRKRKSKDIEFLKRYKADIEHAYESIDKADIFIRALWKATDR